MKASYNTTPHRSKQHLSINHKQQPQKTINLSSKFFDFQPFCHNFSFQMHHLLAGSVNAWHLGGRIHQFCRVTTMLLLLLLLYGAQLMIEVSDESLFLLTVLLQWRQAMVLFVFEPRNFLILLRSTHSVTDRVCYRDHVIKDQDNTKTTRVEL